MKHKTFMLALLATALFLGFSAKQTGAAITVENSATQQSSTAGGDATFTFSNFDMSGGNFLAVLYSGERSASGSDATDVDVSWDPNGSGDPNNYIGVTNANPLDTVENEGAQIASVNYGFFGPSDVGDVIVTLPVAYRGAATVLSLSGVAGVEDAATFGENLGTSSWDEMLNGTVGGYVLAAAVDNTFGASATPPTITGGYVDTFSIQLGADFIPGDSSAGLVQGYGEIDATGIFTETFTPGTSGGNSSRNAGAYLTLTMIPEPGTALLMGLGTLALAGVRRRG